MSIDLWEDWTQRVIEPTREEWLDQAIRALAPLVTLACGVEPKARVSVGFPITGGRGAKRIGECWYGEATADNVPQIFVHPSVEAGVDALEVLCHELIHAALGKGVGHKGAFRVSALKLGLTGPMTATKAGDSLRANLQSIQDQLGPYPHAKLNTSGRPIQKTYLLKAACATCGYTIRLTERWACVGVPACPVCAKTLTLKAK